MHDNPDAGTWTVHLLWHAAPGHTVILNDGPGAPDTWWTGDRLDVADLSLRIKLAMAFADRYLRAPCGHRWPGDGGHEHTCSRPTGFHHAHSGGDRGAETRGHGPHQCACQGGPAPGAAGPGTA